MLFLTLFFEEAEYFHIKNVTRNVDVSKGMFYTEFSQLYVQVKINDHPGYFDYGVPYELLDKVSFVQAKINDKIMFTERILRNDVILPVFFYRIKFSEDFGEATSFILTFTYTVKIDQFVNKYSSLFSPDQQADFRESDRIYQDRTLKVRFATTLPVPYDVSTQILKIKHPLGKLVSYKTDSAPRENSSSIITIGPIQYQPILEVEHIDMVFYAVLPTLEVNSTRTVIPSGFPIRIGFDESQVGLVHVIDKLYFKNLDPSPKGIRRSRVDIAKLKQGQFRVISEITITIPKASNIKIFDRIGKVATRKILQKQDHTIIIVTPRHLLFGQDTGSIFIEYDTQLTQQTYQDFGFTISAAPKISPKAFFQNIKTCILPPSTSSEVQFVSQFPLAFDENLYQQYDFDFQNRNGKCTTASFVDENIANSDVGVKWQIEQKMLENRVKIVFCGIFVFFLSAWCIRCVLQC
ncbi:Dolichyl-diphosphooligosaccharide--protein glycosyltransferase subunit 1 [Spironucleus salmonicida]|uniref:Dolichyl-diphosphooligosaccharide--protein glycosyltransferase subunit 1 n=1 Tax=Spironucleus salmonicida TaxID=348837 RepID=V6LRV7_9EUKA|nr:Dolichyl-diphosphooligosaccharide--protein glycosyltransferase subunit 1 [Spironucleus salmonicida]|eukprot:EST46426.1 Ribophorin I family protein [Spironucleus salmonicida]